MKWKGEINDIVTKGEASMTDKKRMSSGAPEAAMSAKILDLPNKSATRLIPNSAMRKSLVKLQTDPMASAIANA